MSLRGNKRREFPLSVRKAAFARACRDGVPHCENCGTFIRAGHLRYEHLQPDGLQGEPTIENCGVFCDVCARSKDKIDNPIMVKADRVTRKAYGLTRAPRQKIQSRGFAKAAPQRSASRPLAKST